MEVEKILENINQIFAPKSLRGLKAIVTAGPSVEKIDPVRFISNFSTGMQGYEIAKCLRDFGAKTILISGPTKLSPPSDIKLLNVQTGKDFYEKVISNLPCEIFISVAAISDWKASLYSKQKIKKNSKSFLDLQFSKNIDVLKKISDHKKRPLLIIVFSEETNYLLRNTKKKLLEKNCDWIIANKITKDNGFGDVKNTISVIQKDNVEEWPSMSKARIAKKITKKIVNYFKKK